MNEKPKNEFKTPRFVLTTFFTMVTTIAYLWLRIMTSEQYITVIGLILSLWGGLAYTGRMGGKQEDLK